MNINTISHPAVATPVLPPRQVTPLTRNTQPHPFTTLLQQARQPIGHAVPSQLRAESRGLSAQAAMNHAR